MKGPESRAFDLSRKSPVFVAGLRFTRNCPLNPTPLPVVSLGKSVRGADIYTATYKRNRKFLQLKDFERSEKAMAPFYSALAGELVFSEDFSEGFSEEASLAEPLPAFFPA